MERPDHILSALQSCGYQAVYVGGCVRDTLLGRPINDWDITTSALPEQIMEVFDRCVPTGIAHGTVTVLYEGGSAEVTTFRADGEYLDGRHPEQVHFVSALEEDLARRDFTVNAMAMDQHGQIFDPMGGRDDLKRKLLRCVGLPEKRFGEDALRMLRALRFSAQLGFEIEKDTMDAVSGCAHLCRKLSAERVRDEMEKTLLSPRPQMIGEMARLGLVQPYLPAEDRDCGLLGHCPAERAVRWAALCRIYPELDLVAMRLDKKTARDAMAVAGLARPEDRLGWKKLISEQGIERGLLAGKLFGEEETVREILASGECLALSDLAVAGVDLAPMQGPIVGQTLQRLLQHVLEHPEDNQKEVLLRLV